MIKVLQAGRALAALAVVAHHAAASANAFGRALPVWLKFLAGYGYLGVDFFFVLSGFIIYYTSREHTFGHYASSRLKRIYVPYLPVGIGIALLYAALPGLSAGNRHWDWLATLTLLPGRTALIVAWTLQFELAFYAVFAVGKLLGRPILTVALWAAVALLLSLAGVQLTAHPETLVVEFLFGMLAVVAVERGYKALALAPIAFVAFTLTGMRELFGLCMAALIVTLVRMEQSGNFRTPQFLVFLGAASYSIYLVHNPVAALVARYFGFVITFAVAAGAGVLYHVAYERPVLRLLSARRPLPVAVVPL